MLNRHSINIFYTFIELLNRIPSHFLLKQILEGYYIINVFFQFLALITQFRVFNKASLQKILFKDWEMIRNSIASRSSNSLLLFCIVIITNLVRKTIQGTNPLFLTTLTDIETSRWVLALTTPTAVSGVTSESLTLNYINAYTTGTPSVALSFDFISGNYLSTTAYRQNILDLQQTSVGGSSVTIRINRTENFITSMAINYIVVKSGFIMDIRNQLIDLSATTVWLGNVGTRTSDMTVNFKTKSNAMNAIVIYMTSGIYMAKTSNSFEYTLADISKASNSYTLRISVMANNKVRWIRISTISYESIATTIDPPFYLELGFFNSLQATVPDSSGIAVSSMGTIFSGMTDFLIVDTNNVFDYNMSSTGRIFNLVSTSISRSQSCYFWYRQQTCPQVTYLKDHLCEACHYSCLTCFAGTNTSCLSCPSTRTFNNTDKSCPCNSGYADAGVAACQQITCGYACQTCAAMNQCGSCTANFNRILVGTECQCKNYYYDDGVSAPCPPCHISCKTCTAMYNPMACSSCVSTDNRVYRQSNFTCECKAGHFQNYTSACPKCHYTCATCSKSNECLTCDLVLGRQYNSTTKLCSCIAGKYDDMLIQTCSSCPYYCLTCNATACLSCVSSRTLNITTGLCNCGVKFFDDGFSSACQACAYHCATCLQTSECLTCNLVMQRIMNSSTKQCGCVDGFFNNPPNQECASCDRSCRTCSGGAATNCLSCNATAFRSLSLTNQCVCAQGYYQVVNQELCLACSYTCKTCTNTPDCTSCDATKFRQTSGNVCGCMPGYYDDGNQLCSKCYYRCLTCTSSTTCATCDSITRDNSNLVTCSCRQGYYDDGVSTSCLPCQVQCLACTNGNNCTTCPTNKVLTVSKDCQCASGTFQPNCIQCAYSCRQCVDTANKCTLCNGASYRYFESLNNTCPCYDGYFDNGVDQLCSSCHYSCKTCSDFTKCDTCPSNRVINGSVCSCKPQFFQDPSNKNCIGCHYSCQLCSSTSVCSVCDATKFREIRSGSTLCQCMAGYYDDGVNQQCYQCQYDCKTCSSYSHCVTCQSSLNRYLSLTNSCPCLDGFYEDSGFICQVCHFSCEKCSKANQCLTCKTGRSLDAATKLCLCLTGTFNNPSTNVCENCGYPCQQCSQASTNCTKCQAARLLTSFKCPCLVTTFDNGTACQSCLNTCATCTEALKCETCKPALNRNLNLGICQCITGYHDNNGALLTCQACHYSCQTCISSTICLTCASGRIATGGLCSCPINRFYDDMVNPTCPSCHYSCLKCSTSSGNCTECLSSNYRTFVSTNNTCPCDIKYYDDSVSTCKSCQYTCARCSSGSTCASCDSTKFRQYVSGPYCNCLPGYFDISSQLCSQCNYKCKTCQISSTKCLSCIATRTFDSGSNTCPCDQGYFDNLVSTCATCAYSCLTCTTGLDCQTCDTTTRQLSSSKQCICKDGFYNINGIKACAACDQTCLTCSAFSTCTSCDTQTNGRILNVNDCLCQIGFYDDSGNGVYVCQKCHYSCQHCTSSSSCTSCNALSERIMNINTRLCRCRDGFYDNGVNMGCLACPFDCQTCSGPVTCLSCSAQRALNNTSQRCDCASSYYSNGTTCQLCAPECATCTNLNTCQSCNGVRTILGNQCICPQGKYPQAASANCLGCHYSCKSCQSSSQCLTCDVANNRYLSGVYCGCLNSYYDDGVNTACAACQYTCKTCTVGNRCTTCDSSIQRVYNGGTQLCSCSSGYYEDPTSKQCIKCHYTCTSCSSGSTCTVCNALHLRSLSGSNQCTCPSIAFYDDGTNSQCASCSPYCVSCSIISTNCTACATSSPTQRTLSAGKCVCRTGFFQFNSQVNCLPCDYQCVTCQINSNNCTLCSSANNRQTGTTACACLPGFYDDGSNALCKTCNMKCLTCNDGLTCATCQPNNKRQLSATTKLCQCMINHYQTNQPACGQCFYTCGTCDHGSLCLSCPATRTYNTGVCSCNRKFYDDGSSLLCQSCHYSCNDCTNFTQCSVCSSSHFRQYDSNTKYCTCLVGYYQQNSQQLCIKCESSCATCTNGTHCETCPSNINKTLNAASGSNYCVCLDHYYQDVFTIVNNHIACKACHYSCQTCQTQSHFCTACDSNSHRTINSQQQCLCDSTYYDDGINQMCLRCYVGCLTCWGSAINQCLTCSGTTYMLNNTCYSNCPNYYYNNIKVCSACPSYCLSCTNSTFCNLCQNNFFILSIAAGQKRCYDTCPQYYYSNTTHCLQCISPCRTCTNKYVCTDCIQKHYLMTQCQPCYSLCQSCTGGSANQCISCADPQRYYIQNGQCLKITCASNQYVHPTLGCKNCSDDFPKALECSSTGVTKCQQGFKTNSGQCFSCANVLGYSLTNGVCQEICGDGLVFQSKCDDNNTLNGDGCSSLCMVQVGWQCLTPSTCQLSISPTIKSQSITKIKNSNKIHIVLVLNVGLRLIKQNFVLTFSGGQTYTHSLYALNTIMTRYKLQIEYFSSIVNSVLNIKIVSPAHSTSRLLQIRQKEAANLDCKVLSKSTQRMLLDLNIENQLSVDIDLSLDFNLTVTTNPPSTYISPQTRNSYGLGLMIFLAVVRAVFLFVLIVVVVLRLKVMLHMIDSLKIMTLLYLLASFGMHSISQLTQSYVVVLRPFIYPFGQPFPDNLSDISPAQTGFTKLIISSFLIQILIIVVLSLWQIIKPSSSVNYFKTSFMFALVYDLLISSVIVFSWVGVQSYGDAFSWAFALVITLMVVSQSGFYYNIAQQYRKKGRSVVPGISNATAQKDNQLNDQEKRVQQFIDYRDKSEIDSDITQPMPITYSKQNRTYDTTLDGQNHYQPKSQLEELYDLAPSQVLTPIYLPVNSLVIPCLFCIIFMIQTPIVRMPMLAVLCIASFCFNVVKLPLRNYRTIKILILDFICFLISIIGLVGSIMALSSSNSLYFVEPTIATLVVIGVVFNTISIIIAVYKSDSLTQFIVARKNKSIINKNTTRNSKRSPIKSIFQKKFEYGEEDIEQSENNEELDQTGIRSNEKKYYQKVRDPRKMTKESPLGNDPSFISRDSSTKQVKEALNLEQLGIGYNVLKKQMDKPQNRVGSPSKRRRLNSSDDQQIFTNFNTNKQLLPSQSQTSLISQQQMLQKKRKSPQKGKIKKTFDAMRDTGIDNMPVGIKPRQSPEWQAENFGNKKLERMDSISSIEEQRKHFKKQQDEGQAMTVFKKILNDYQESKHNKNKKGLIRKIKK